MTLRVNTQDLVDEVTRMRAVSPDYQWSKNMLEPHPSWNGRECIRLAPGGHSIS